jgi:hypothetical protein
MSTRRSRSSACSELTWLSVAYLAIAAALATTIIQQVNFGFRQEQRAAELRSVRGSVHAFAQRLKQAAHSGLDWSRADATRLREDRSVESLVTAARRARSRAALASWIFIAVSGLFILLAHHRGHPTTIGLGLVSATSLVIGLFAPALLVVVQQPVPLLGEPTWSEAKSIASASIGLLTSSNWPVGLILILCGILIPTVKLLALNAALILKSGRTRRVLAATAQLCGRWGMADVLALALVVSCLSLRGTPLSHARLEIGAWFYSAHAVLAILAGHLVSHLRSDPSMKGESDQVLDE